MPYETDEIIGRALMTNHGAIMGTITQALFDRDTGKPSHLIIRPTHDINAQMYHLTPKGDIVVPYGQVTRVKNVMVFEEKTLEKDPLN